MSRLDATLDCGSCSNLWIYASSSESDLRTTMAPVSGIQRNCCSKRGLASGGLREVENRMLWTIFVILLVLWLVGLVSSYTLGGFIHLLLLAALVVLILQLVSGRRPVV